MPFQDASAHEDGQQEFADFLDKKVADGEFTPEQAYDLASERGLPTGPGSGYLPVGYVDPQAAGLNKVSEQTRLQSEDYQKTRAAQGLGYDPESQAGFNRTHPRENY